MTKAERQPVLQLNSFLFFEEITEDHRQALFEYLAVVENDPDIAEGHIYIDSPGGDLWASLACAEIIQRVSTRKPVNTITTGLGYSGALLIAASGSEGRRQAWSSAEFMLHELIIGQDEGLYPMQKLREMMKENENINNRWLKAVSKFIKQPVAILKKDLSQGDLYMTARQAQQYGVIDKVIYHRH